MRALYRTLALPVYVPSMLMATGQTIAAVMLPLHAIKLGGHPAEASLVVGALSIGSLVANVPAGLAVSRYGDKRVMLLALLLAAAADLVLMFAADIAILALAGLVMGAGFGMWMLSRLAYMAEAVPLAQRGRAIALMGGTQRLGGFVGPAIGGLLAVKFGFGAAFAVALLCFVSGLLLVRQYTANHPGEHAPGATSPSGQEQRRVQRGARYKAAQHEAQYRAAQHDASRNDDARSSKSAVHTGLANQWHVLLDYRRVFATAGIAVFAIAVVRGAYGLLIPLWGTHIGLNAADVGLAFSILSGIDMVMFYPAGIVMDRYGRKWVGVPCLALLGVSLLLLPTTIGFWTLGLLGLLFGFSNGLGSGIVMTMGSDLAPQRRRGEFLGVWRSLADLGFVSAPLMIGALTASVSLTAACVSCAAFGVVGALIMAFGVRESLRPQPASG